MKEKTMDYKKVGQLMDIKRELEKHLDGKLEYHGLKDLNDDGFPYFIQWNHKYPCIEISGKTSSQLVTLPSEIGFAIEKMLGNVSDDGDFQKQIDEGFELKNKSW